MLGCAEEVAAVENMWMPRQLCGIGSLAGPAAVDNFWESGSVYPLVRMFHVEHWELGDGDYGNVPRGTFVSR